MTIHITLPSAVEWSFYLVGLVTGIVLIIAFAYYGGKMSNQTVPSDERKVEGK